MQTATCMHQECPPTVEGSGGGAHIASLDAYCRKPGAWGLAWGLGPGLAWGLAWPGGWPGHNLGTRIRALSQPVDAGSQ